ncbi:MAG: hypothetical protein HY617_03505, partial [Candidatus Sungbacteria bacterium]|nr:hypothetical protein [Candidatus Sungbacteria bacterium]
AEIEMQLEQLKAQQGPSVADQVAGLEREQQEAVAAKNYARAAEIGQQIDQLQGGKPATTSTVTPPITAPQPVVNGPIASDAAALATKRAEVDALITAKNFRVPEQRQQFYAEMFSAKTLPALEALRQRVVALP